MSDSGLHDQMRRFERLVIERDATAAEEVLDREFALVLVHPVPATMHRNRWLEVLPDYVVHEWEAEEQRVDDDGAAAPPLLQRIRMRATVLGEHRSGPFVISDLWRLRGGTWRI